MRSNLVPNKGAQSFTNTAYETAGNPYLPCQICISCFDKDRNNDEGEKGKQADRINTIGQGGDVRPLLSDRQFLRLYGLKDIACQNR